MNASTGIPGIDLWSARRAVGLLLAINLFNYIDRYVLAAVVPELKKEFFAPDDPNARFWLGTLFTAFLVSYMVIAPLFGWLADRMNRWVIIGGAVILWSLASGASGLAVSFAMLLATRLFVGIGEAGYGPTAPTIIADLYPVARRGSVLSWFYAAIPVGSALGFGLGGFIASHWGATAAGPSPDGWRMAFYAVVPPGLLLGLLCFLMREPRRGASEKEGHVTHAARKEDYLTLLHTPSYVWNTLGMTAMTFALGGVSAWMPDYIHDYRGQPNLGHVNMIFGAITVLAGLIATPLGGYLGDRLSRHHQGAYFLVSAVGMLIGFPCFLLVLVAPFPAAWFFIFVAEFCLFLNTGPTNTILANVTHPAIRASGYAVNIFFIHILGDAISPPLIGKVAGIYGGNMNAGFLVVSLAILVSGVFWLLGARHLARDTELAPTRLNRQAEE